MHDVICGVLPCDKHTVCLYIPGNVCDGIMACGNELISGLPLQAFEN